jgi:hypothetical protein
VAEHEAAIRGGYLAPGWETTGADVLQHTQAPLGENISSLATSGGTAKPSSSMRKEAA